MKLLLLTSIFSQLLVVESTSTFRFFPEGEVELVAEERATVFGTAVTDDVGHLSIFLKTNDERIAKISGNSSLVLESTNCSLINVTNGPNVSIASGQISCFNFSFQIDGIFLGFTEVAFYNGEVEEDTQVLLVTYDVVVLKGKNIVSDIFTYALIVIVAINTVGFGCTISLSEMWQILKKPVAPMVGLGCQFIINPVVAFGLGKAFTLSPSLALGLFAVGCCPGGGGSNLWTYLLNGDLDLSILMTFCSTIVCFGMLPLWIYTLGRTIAPESVEIPFTNLVISLVSLVVPCLIGVIIKTYKPKLANFLRKLIKPIAVFMILLIFSVGIYSNLYMFELMRNWKILVCGLLAPYSAYIVSATVAWICRQPKKRILTISIETAIQNTSIAIVMILTTFPKPEADIAAVMPIATVMFTPLPLIITLIVKTIRTKCFGSKNAELEKGYPTSKFSMEGVKNSAYKNTEITVSGKQENEHKESSVV